MPYHHGMNCVPKTIAIFATLSHLCRHVAAEREGNLTLYVPIDWNIIDRYGQESYWLHPDSKFKFTVTVLKANVTGYIEFGQYIRREPDGSRTKQTIWNKLIERETNYTYSFGPHTVEDFSDASIHFWVNVTVSLPPPVETSAQQFIFAYVLCMDEEDQCQNAHSTCRLGENMFCFRNYSDCQTFRYHDGLWCTANVQFSKHLACSEKGTNFLSLCSGYVNPKHFIRSLMKTRDLLCGGLEVFLKDQATGSLITPGSYRLRSKLMTIGCFRWTDSYLLRYLKVRIIERAEGGTVLFSKKDAACNASIKLNDPQSVFSVTYLTVSDDDPEMWHTLSFVKLVNMMFSENHLLVKMCRKVLQCILTAPLPVPGSFRASIVLFKYDQRPKAESKKLTFEYVSSNTLNITVEGYYVCQVKIRFRGCAPFTEFERTVEKVVHVESLGICAELESTNIPAFRPWAVIIIAVIVPLTVVAALTTWYFIRWKVNRQKKAGGVRIEKDKKGFVYTTGRKGKQVKEKDNGKTDTKKGENIDSKASASESKVAKAAEIKKARARHSPKEKDRKLKTGPKSREKHRLPSTAKVPESSQSETTTSSESKSS